MTQKIWISYHKDEQIEQYNLKEDATHVLFPTHKEVEGVNINHMNPVYSEMVTMWYVWQNKIKSKYIGFEHYRRRMNTEELPAKGECIVYKIMDFLFESVYNQYARCHRREDIDMMLHCLDNRYGVGNPYTKNLRESHYLISNCCFIMRWEDFVKMCEFLFPLLDDFAAMCGISNTNVQEWRKKAVRDFGENPRTDYQTRILSFLAERLISAWIFVNLVPFEKNQKVVTVHYNTPDLLEKAILSMRKNAPGYRVYILDNSDKEPFTQKMTGVEVLDNTKGQLIDFKKMIAEYPDRTKTSNDYGSAKHSYSIQWLIDYFNEPFVLMDSDILFCKGISTFFNEKYAFAGTIAEDTMYAGFPVKRVLPVLCYLNPPMLKERGVRFFNSKFMWNLTSKEPNNHFDTGAWFYKEIEEKHLPYCKIDIMQYIKHMWHGSWIEDSERDKKWLEENKTLWQA